VFEVAAGMVIHAAEIRAPDTARDHVVPGRGVEGDEGGAELGHAGTPSMESGLRKGYRGSARRSSNVGVPESARLTRAERGWGMAGLRGGRLVGGKNDRGGRRGQSE